MKAVLAALVALAACGEGEVGTILLGLTTAPGSTVIDEIQNLRVTLTDPRTVIEATRTASGFDLVLDVEASGGAGTLIVEGFDAGGALLAAGRSPAFPVAAITARIVVYLAPPLTIGLAPVSLPVAREGVASATLTFGLVLAGGQDAAGAETSAIFIYNAFDHSLLGGLAMPDSRSFQTLAVGSNNAVYLFGGRNAADVPTGSLWRFDTTTPPSGSYSVLPDQPALAREASSAIRLGPDRFVITGAPPLDLTFTALSARTDAAEVSANGASVDVAQSTALFAGDPIQRFDGDRFEPIAASADASATAVTLPDRRVAFVGGDSAPRDLLVVLAIEGTATRLTNVLSTDRRHAAVAASSRYVVVAGGLDLAGVAIPSADILDAATLSLITTIPCAPRSRATAHLLPNDQIAIVGGTPATAVIELFTPPPLAP